MLKPFIRVAVLLALSVPLAVMAQESTPEPAPIQLPEVDPLVVEGDVATAGSSTVYPLSEAVAELFTQEGYLGNVTIDSIGTGAGFERFCTTGETDIANASRAIKDSEIANCAAIGRHPIPFRVGTDALTVAISSANTFAQDLTLEQLGQIFSGQAATWADVNPDWPAEPIQLFSPGTDSGTFDYFVEVVFQTSAGMTAEEGDAAILNAPGIQLSEDDNVLVQGIEGSPYAIGYFGYAYYQENRDRLRALSINGVTPTEETTESGEYPLARPLFIYSDAQIMQDKPPVADFINYYLTRVNEVIGEVGYFPASASALNESKARWLMAMGMDDQIPADVMNMLQAEATPAA